MPSISFSATLLSTAGLVALRRGAPVPKQIGSVAVRPALLAVLAASTTYSLWTSLLVFPRPQRIKQEPIACKNIIKRFFLQHVADILELGILDMATRIGLQPGMAAGVMMVREQRVFTGNAEDMDHVLNTNSGNYKKGREVELFRRFFGDSLFTIIEADIHKVHRRIVGPAFSPKALRHLADTCVPTLTRLAIDRLKTKIATEGHDGTSSQLAVQEWLDGLTFAVIAQAAFKTGGGDEKAIKEVRRIFTDGFDAAFTQPRCVPLIEKLTVTHNWRAALERENAAKLVRPIIEQNKQQDASSDKVRHENADALIDYLSQSKELTEQQVADHCVGFLFAGFETTSTSLGWLMGELARKREVQGKLFEEVSSCVGLGVEATMDDIQGCTYLNCVCKEILRLYSPVSMLSREALQDDVLPGTKTFIPKGSGVMNLLCALQINPQYWGPDAAEFKPERWEEPGFDEKVNGVYWMPFMVGKRNCIGKDFAMNEMQLILAQLVRNFEFSWPEGQPDPEPFVVVTTRPKVPFNVQVTCRLV